MLKRGLKKIKKILKDDSGLSVVEMILILVVIIALVMLFKKQLILLINQIFGRIFRDSAGI